MHLWKYIYSILFCTNCVFSRYNIDLSDRVIVAVNCGGPQVLGAFNIKYRADILDIGSPSDHGNKYSFPNAHDFDNELYKTERWSENDFSYTFRIMNDGYYVVMLKFSEVYFARDNEKIFDVAINDFLIIKNLDVFLQAGGAGMAYDQYIQLQVVNEELFVNGHLAGDFDGTLQITFLKGLADNPKVNAIAIVKGMIDEMPERPYQSMKPWTNEQTDEIVVEDEEPDDWKEMKSTEEIGSDESNKHMYNANPSVNKNPYDQPSGRINWKPILLGFSFLFPALVLFFVFDRS